jgi:hypothetical protein
MYVYFVAVVVCCYLDSLPTLTLPIKLADGATKDCSDTCGATPLTATNRVDGTNRSVYLVISIFLPILSRAVLMIHDDGKNILDNEWAIQETSKKKTVEGQVWLVIVSYPTLRMTLANPSEALATNDVMMKGVGWETIRNLPLWSAQATQGTNVVVRGDVWRCLSGNDLSRPDPFVTRGSSRSLRLYWYPRLHRLLLGTMVSQYLLLLEKRPVGLVFNRIVFYMQFMGNPSWLDGHVPLHYWQIVNASCAVPGKRSIIIIVTWKSLAVGGLEPQ